MFLRHSQWRTKVKEPRANNEESIHALLMNCPPGSVLILRYPSDDEDIYSLTEKKPDA